MQWLHYAIDYGIIGLLVVMSILAFSIGIERYLFFKRLRLDNYENRKSLELELTEHLHLIAIVGSNAPYIGLLGTVFGIMLTFYTMGKSGFMDTSKIMISLALALKVTAVGLLVAIPAIVVYNLLLRKVKVLVIQWEIKNGQ
jgi:biopolymer transport protein ExbB